MVRPGLCVSGVRLEPVFTLGRGALDGWVTSYMVRATPRWEGFAWIKQQLGIGKRRTGVKTLPFPARRMMDAGVWYAQVEHRDWLYVWVKAVSWGLHERVRGDVAKASEGKKHTWFR